MTSEEGRAILRAALTDEVMKAQREQVLMAVARRARDLLDGLGLGYALDLPEVAERFHLFREMHHVPGDHLWQAMQFVFRVARDGGDDADKRLIGHYTQIIDKTLFSAPLKVQPQIPDDWWQTPLGVACRVVEQGVDACLDVLLALQDSEGEVRDGD